MKNYPILRGTFMNLFIYIILFCFLISTDPIEPCTGICLTADNNAIIYARTLEFAQNIHSSIVFIPRKVSFTGTTPYEKKPGLSWKTKYAAIGANAADEIGIIDGVNEKGLAGGLFYLPNYAEYQQITDTDLSKTIAPWELMTFLLTTCSTVAEVKKVIHEIKVANVVFAAWDIIPPVHAIVHDTQGNSLVIEYIKGQLQLYDNPLGVITNSPSFDWHMTNLNNYTTLSPVNPKPLKLNDVTLAPFGQGAGLFGLPGDFTPPSRFVRAVFMSQNVIELKDEEEARTTAFHILDLFDIPRGIIRAKEKQVTYEYTQWTSAVDLRNKRYYFHTYENRDVQMADLMKFNLDTQTPQIVMAMNKQ